MIHRISVYYALLLVLTSLDSLPAQSELPVRVGEFTQQFHRPYCTDSGLPNEGIAQIKLSPSGEILCKSDSGLIFIFKNERWESVDEPEKSESLFEKTRVDSVFNLKRGSSQPLNDIALYGDEVAVAAVEGLYVRKGKDWELALPQQGQTRWAPVDVRAVTYDHLGQLWFAAPQGVGCRTNNEGWVLFTGEDGLPYNDFTCIAAGPKGVWFGTTNGAIQYQHGKWSFRQGGRWLLDNHVRDIAVDSNGNAWIATSKGISCIANKPMTLAEKAAYYEEEIEKYNRRTRFGYVNPAILSEPGEKSTAKPTYSDNDGFNTGLYLAAVSYGYAATSQPKLEKYAHNAFRALAFLSEVTQGGEHAAPKGFVARNVIPVSEPDPNERYDLEYDLRRNQRDKLWKIMQPRLPIDKTGQWYWKCDASSDELDGHFFGYSAYYDLICKTDQEKEQVRKVVRRIMDHVLEHNYSMVDYDGKPTRWGHFSPEDMNQNPAWKAERGINSYCILGYLASAHHITQDPKYRSEYLKLAIEHGYGMNGMSQYKWNRGGYSQGHQPGDNMMFMNYYHLLRYETDPRLLSMYQFAISRHWTYEKYERNAFTNFIYAACCKGQTRKDNWGETDLSPPDECYEDAIDSLKRYPLDLVEWPMSNAHRLDMRPLEGQPRETATIGTDRNGYLFPIDERHEVYWDWDPWKLTGNGTGKRLRPGFHYLLAYYMGRYHGYIDE